MLRAVLLALSLAGCDLLFQLDHVPTRDAALGAWTPPQPMTELNDPIATDTDASMTGDLLELYFSSNRPGGEGLTDVYRATRGSVAEPFSPPMRVPELSGVTEDNGFISTDGRSFYVTHTPQMGLQVASRANRGELFTSFPTDDELSALPNGINYELSADGLQATGTAPVGGDLGELYLFTRTSELEPWGPPVRATELNSQGNDGGGTFDTHGLTVIFHSTRASSERRLFVATRASVAVPFGFPLPILEIGNGPASDPWVSPDLHVLVFNRNGDLFITTR